MHGYEEWGAGLWERLRGMFAVAIWDARRERLTLARDRFGIKPLYYRCAGGELAFASELDALPHGEIDLDALEAFLAFNIGAGAALDLPRHPQAAARAHAHLGGRRRSASTGSRGRGRCLHATTRTRPSSSRSAARASATRFAPT